jgi:hypothetical protein
VHRQLHSLSLPVVTRFLWLQQGRNQYDSQKQFLEAACAAGMALEQCSPSANATKHGVAHNCEGLSAEEQVD